MEKLGKGLISWASVLEPKTLEQARRTATMPFIYPHLALMPDAHLGLGATVGSVIPTLGAVMPAAVGVDIGCGMIAVRTQFEGSELRAGHSGLSGLREAIEAAVPTSAGGYNTTLTETALVRVADLESDDAEPERVAGNWRLQLGMLGSGNHFIEVSVDEADRVWLFLHSGSRGVGNRMAQKLLAARRRWWISLPDEDLAYLVEAAGETFTHDRLRAAMAGIEYRDTDAFLDEIPAAYKDIDQVMADAADLVDVRHTLRQLVNVKGD